jgi:L-rhamnose isomerase
LRINFPEEKKYIRYEPKKLSLLKYEYDNLSKDLKLKYLEYKFFEENKVKDEKSK